MPPGPPFGSPEGGTTHPPLGFTQSSGASASGRDMIQNVYKPFERDVVRSGGYQYTKTERRSSVYANHRYSNVIIGNAPMAGKTVVDVGCGDGTYTAGLAAQTGALSVLGIDPARAAVELAARTYEAEFAELTFRCGFAADLLAEGRHFDVAICRGVIHHVADPAAEIATVLKLADNVFFLEPNGWNPILKLMERYSPYHREHEERSYRLGQFRRWIQEAGGRIEKSFYFGLVPFFCPDWMVSVGSALEPFIEALPLVRVGCCGQLGILASRTGK
jgi:SAM-dependent methyltransferase